SPPRASAAAVAPPTRRIVLRRTVEPSPSLLVPCVLVAAVRCSDVRERGRERVLVRIDTVADDVVRLEVAETEQRVQERAVPARDRPDLDVGHVVDEAPAVGEPLQ